MSACAIISDVKETLFKVTLMRRVTFCLKLRLEANFPLSEKQNAVLYILWTAEHPLGTSGDSAHSLLPLAAWLHDMPGC